MKSQYEGDFWQGIGSNCRADGWNLLRVHGSHHIYGRTGSVVRLSIPLHGNKPLKIGLLRHLMNLAGLSESDLQ